MFRYYLKYLNIGLKSKIVSSKKKEYKVVYLTKIKIVFIAENS